MKIAIAQTKSIKGDILTNIQNHLRSIEKAIALGADIIIFPELSITGYEPTIAAQIAIDIGDDRFNVFQELSDENEICIGIGVPTKAKDGINISMLLFQPNNKRIVYSKNILHTDELPYFVSGNSQPFLNIQNQKIALGICYETLQKAHFIKASEHKADIFIASVAKPDRGIEKAYIHFPSMAKEFGIPILMSNCIGYCDNFRSTGKSAVWNDKGQLMGQLGEGDEGILIFDTKNQNIAK